MPEKAIWPAAPVVELLDARGIGEARLKALRPPISFKRHRALLTTATADSICQRVLRMHPASIWPEWADADDQEEMELWA